jgi:hypothetical protein
MRNLLFYIAIALIFTSCDDKPVVYRDSAGRLNDILVVMDNADWEGAVGDTIREELARPIEGIIRDEPLFTLNHIKPESFDGKLTKSRNYLIIKKDGDAKVTVEEDKYAYPQLGVVAHGNSSQEVAETIAENSNNIIELFSRGETAQKQYLMNKTILDTGRLEETFGISMTIPRTYHYAKNRNDDDFVWLRRGIAEGTVDLMVYEVPLEKISRDKNTVSDIIAVRDSIGAIKIPVNEPGVFITEKAYSPLLYETQIDGKFAFETKGIWEVKTQWMSGPFINYAVYNAEKNNWLILEGYVSAPNTAHRNYLFEIEAILRSTNFLDDNEKAEN